MGMSKSLEELVVVGFIALLALKLLSSNATAVAAQSTTLGQTAGYANIGEGVLTTFVSDFGLGQ